VEALDLVGQGGGVTPALLGADVHHDGPVPLAGVGEGPLDRLDVVTVDRARVAHAELLEERRRLPQLPHGRLGRLGHPLEPVSDHGHRLEHPLEPRPLAHERGVEAEPGEALAELRDRRGVRPPVVVEDDDHLAAAVPEVVQPLVGHATGERPVADDGHHLAVALTPEGEPRRHPVGVAEDGRGVAVLDPVVLGLGAVGVAREPTGLAQRGERLAPAGDQLVHVGLVARVPEQDVLG
jgi:hypothetical protein